MKPLRPIPRAYYVLRDGTADSVPVDFQPTFEPAGKWQGARLLPRAERRRAVGVRAWRVGARAPKRVPA